MNKLKLGYKFYMSCTMFCLAFPAVSQKPLPPVSNTPSPAAVVVEDALLSYRCEDYEANPIVADVFESDRLQKYVFFMSPVTGIITPPDFPLKPGEEALKPIQKFMIYRINIAHQSYSPVLNLQLRPGPVLIPAGDPLMGLTALSYGEVDSKCFHGKAMGLSALLTQWEKDDRATLVRSFPEGNYRVIPGREGRMVVDLDIRRIKEVDPVTFQMRNAQSFQKQFIPIYVFQGAARLVGIDVSSKPTLKRIVLNRSNLVESEQVLEKDWYVLRQEGNIGLVKIEDSSEEITLKEIPGWMEVMQTGVFKLNLGKGVKAKHQRFEIDWMRRKLLAIENDQNNQSTYKKILRIYDYESGKELNHFTVDKGEYIHTAKVDQAGKYVILLTRKTAGHTHAKVLGYRFRDNQWKEWPQNKETLGN